MLSGEMATTPTLVTEPKSATAAVPPFHCSIFISLRSSFAIPIVIHFESPGAIGSREEAIIAAMICSKFKCDSSPMLIVTRNLNALIFASCKRPLIDDQIVPAGIVTTRS